MKKKSEDCFSLFEFISPNTFNNQNTIKYSAGIGGCGCGLTCSTATTTEFPIWVFHFLREFVQRQQRLDCNYQCCHNNYIFPQKKFIPCVMSHSSASKNHTTNKQRGGQQLFSLCGGLAPFWTLETGFRLNLVRSRHAPNRFWKCRKNLGAILPPTLLVSTNCLLCYIDSLFSARNPSCPFFPASALIQKVKCNQ